MAVVSAFAFRAKSLTVGVGGDEFSLLAMAVVIAEGGIPYADFWDVRPPLAYLWGLPSAYIADTVAAIKTFRLLALFAQGTAAWLFFCLFRRQLGSLAAALGAATLLASANIVPLHQAALPNHFLVVMSLAAFAAAVEGIRLNLRWMYLVSAVLAGLLPWTMVHASLVALAIAVMAISGARHKDRWPVAWLAVAALPSVLVVGAYALWGPFDTFVRTVLVAPVDFAGEGFRSASFFPFGDLPKTRLSLAIAHYVVLLLAGFACLPGVLGKATSGSPLRLSPWIVMPPILPLILMTWFKGGAPEYWIDAAPTAALLAAVAAHRIFSLRAWAMLGRLRYLRPSVLRGCAAVYFVLVLAALTRFDDDAVEPALPTEYCEAAYWWMERLEPDRTVLDTSALCGYWMLRSGASLHPPFTFTDHWFRQLERRWVGRAVAGDGSETAATERLGAAIGPRSAAGIILADRRICDEIRKRDWQTPFSREWIRVWFRRVEGYDAGDRLSMLTVFVRRDVFLDAREDWLEAEACGDGCFSASQAD